MFVWNILLSLAWLCSAGKARHAEPYDVQRSAILVYSCVICRRHRPISPQLVEGLDRRVLEVLR
jgi:hypothetical protein